MDTNTCTENFEDIQVHLNELYESTSNETFAEYQLPSYYEEIAEENIFGDIDTIFESEEICSFVEDSPHVTTPVNNQINAFVPKVCTRSIIGRLLGRRCDCERCEISEKHKAIAVIKRSILRHVKINFGRRDRIGIYNLEFFKALCEGDSLFEYDLDPRDLMSDVAEIYYRMASSLTEDVFQTYEIFILDNVDCELLNVSRTLDRVLKSNFLFLRSKLYNIHCLRNEIESLTMKMENFDRENLVGIEHNPGPKTECAPTLKRSVAVSKILISLEKRKDKKKCLKREFERDLKQHQKFFPEGLFEVGLDASSRKLFEDILCKITEGMKVTHTIDFGITGRLNVLLDHIMSLGVHAFNFFKGIVLTVSVFLKSSIRSLVALFLGEPDLFVDAPEMFAPEMNYESVLPAAFTLLHTKFLSSFISISNWDEFTESVCKLKAQVNNSTSTVSFFMKLIKEMTTLLCDMYSLENPFDKDVHPDVAAVQAEAKTLAARWREGVDSDYDFADRVHVLYSELEGMLYEKRKTYDAPTKEKITYLLRKFQPIENYCMRYINPNNGPRVEPLAMVVAGPTGAGKSTFTMPILLPIMNAIIPQEHRDAFLKNHNDFIFYRNNENEYWDGYKQRNVVIVYDDFGQMRDVVGKPNLDAFELIRTKNVAPYHLHFASLEDKQRNYATPKIIYATTNLRKMYFDSLTSSRAVVRRFDLSYVQVPKLEFCVEEHVGPFERVLDLEKLRRVYPETEDVSTFAIVEAIEFIPWDFNEGRQADGPILSYNDFVKKAIQTYQKLNNKGDRMLKYHQLMKTFKPEMEFQDIKEFPHVVYDVCASIASYIPKYRPVEVKPEIKEVALKCAQFACVFTTMYVVFSKTHDYVSYLFGNTPEGSYSKSEVKNHRVKNLKNARMRVAKRSLHKSKNGLVAESNDLSIDAYLSVIKRNMYILQSGANRLGWLTFIRGRTFMIPRHFESAIYSNVDSEGRFVVSLINPYSDKVVAVLDWDEDLDLYDLYEDEEVKYDYLFFRVKNLKVRSHSDISKYFTSQKKPKHNEFYNSQIAVIRNNVVVFQLPKVEFTNDVTYECADLKLKSKNLYYSCGTTAGDCGSPLMTQDSRFGRPTILGFHTAGTPTGWNGTKNCCGVFISAEEIQDVLECFGEENFVEKLPIMEVESFTGFNTLAELKQPRVPSKSKLVETPMKQYLWENVMKPAYLTHFTRDGQVISPLTIARTGYSHNEIFIDSEILSEITPVIITHLLQKRQQAPWAPRLLTFEEAVCGVPGVDYVESLNRSTSPGYPYVLSNKGKGKTQWFGKEGDIQLDTPKAKEVRQNVEALIEDARNGVRNLNVFIDYLKDEKRPIAKVEAGKTRQFMACGMDYLIAVKMYFGDYIRHVCQNRILNSIAVGINPFDEWESLARYMTKNVSPLFTAGDYSKFDAKIPVPIAFEVLKCVEAFYVGSTPEDRRVRHILFQEIVNSMHLSEGRLYEFIGGNPSGQPFTSIFNSIANLLMLAYNCGCIGKSDPEFDFKMVFDRTRIQVFGDDNIIGYDPIDSKYWDQQVLEQTIPLNLGMDYTNEIKDSSTVNERSIFEISFLKRKFKLEKGVWLCPLDIVTLKETMLWQKEDTGVEEMKLRIECVLSEFARHGKGVFEEYAPKIVEASVRCYDYFPLNTTYQRAMLSALSLSE